MIINKVTPAFTNMKWISTRGNAPPVDFQTALLTGMAPDGGLYMPERLPEIYPLKENSLHISHTASSILHSYLDNDIPQHDIVKITAKALSFDIPLVQVGDYQVLELFHGPTQAFKDIAAQVLAQLMEYFLLKQHKKITLLVATSGDTGGAVAQAFGGLEHMNVVILYPKGQISQYQTQQITYVAQNIMPIEVAGSFDDCQAFVKQAFQDESLQTLNLSTANSINIGRLLPQISYYAHTAIAFKNDQLHFVVPSGNMGNVTAGAMARISGFPIKSLTAAFNANDPVVKYLQSGIFHPQKSVGTLSNAMDIGNPSNLERLRYLYQDDVTALKNDISAVSISDEMTINTMQLVYKKFNYLLDPHTAVAWAAAERTASSAANTIIVSTASPIKFAEEIYKATGIRQKPAQFAGIGKYMERTYQCTAEYNDFKRMIMRYFA